MTKKALTQIIEIADEELVDYVGGTQCIKEWAMDLIHTHYRNNKSTDDIVLVLKKKKGDLYSGAIYIKKEDFNGNTG